MADFLYTLIIYPLEQLIELSFAFCMRVFRNQGISVLFVSVTVTLFCLPLYIVAERWQETQRKTEARLKDGVERIKRCFKGDEQYMILTTFYRQNHYHPMMALRSSFSLLIQVPFFIAAYHFLSHLESLKGVSFLFIRDMGSPDALFSVGSFSINILPILMTIINCVSGAIYSKGHEAKEKIQIYGMAAIFLVLLYNSPAGLVVYWTMNNVFSLVKNIFYKIKNPLKALYICLCTFILAGDIYLIFIGHGLLKKRLALAAAISVLALLPLFVRFVNFLVSEFASPLLENKKLRTKLFLFSTVCLALFCGFVIPSEMVSSSVQEFSDIDGIASPFYFLRNSLFQGLGFFLFWPVCIYFLFGKRIQTILSIFFSAFLICGVVNTYIFPGDYGSLNNNLMFLNDILGFEILPSLINLLVLVAVLAAVLLLLKFFSQSMFIVSSGLCVVFVAISVFNAVKIHRDYKSYRAMVDSEEAIDAIEPRFSLSSTGKNVVCIMLDCAESAYVERIFEELPQLGEMFDGFVYYKNTVSYNGHTLMSSPSLFGGYEYTPFEINSRADLPLLETQTQSLLMLARVFSEELGYDAFLFDAPWANFSHIPDMRITEKYPKITGGNLMRPYVDIWKKEHPGTYNTTPLTSRNMKRNFIYVSLFRLSPVFSRSFIYDNGRYLGLSNIKDAGVMLTAYSAMDYLPELTKISDSSEGSFVYMVNDMTHEGDLIAAPEYKFNEFARFDENANYFKLTGYSGNASAFVLLGEWFEYLKENGVYDNTRIILVSDHGNGTQPYEFETPYVDNGNSGRYERKDKLHPILLEKDFNLRGGVSVNMDFMTTADVPSLALQGLLENPKNPFTGNPIDMKMKSDGAIVTTSHNHQPVQQLNNKFRISDDEWFLVKDTIFKDENWTRHEAP